MAHPDFLRVAESFERAAAATDRAMKPMREAAQARVAVAQILQADRKQRGETASTEQS